MLAKKTWKCISLQSAIPSKLISEFFFRKKLCPRSSSSQKKSCLFLSVPRSSLLLLFLYWYSPGSSITFYLKFQRTWLGTCGSASDNPELFPCTHQVIEDHTCSRAGTFQWSQREAAKRDEPPSPETSESLNGDGFLPIKARKPLPKVKISYFQMCIPAVPLWTHSCLHYCCYRTLYQ